MPETMFLTLNVNSVRSLIAPKGRAKPKMGLLDVPRMASDEFGLRGLSLATDLLKGATRQVLVSLRDQGDKTGCACLLLSESDPLAFADPKDDKGDAAVARMSRVIEAAHLLGCSSASVAVKAPGKGVDAEDAFELAIERLKRVSDRAERLEVNVLLAPAPGPTEDPEQTTELIKRVGGFRLGTLPDLETAVATDDPAGYLRRLTPFAAGINVPTFEFEEPPPPEPSAKPAPAEPAEGGADDAAVDAAVDLAADVASELAKDAAGDAEEPALSGPEALLAALEEFDEEDDLPPPPVHTTYELAPLLSTIAAVGYDGMLAIDFRGPGDGTLGIRQSREALDAALDSLND